MSSCGNPTGKAGRRPIHANGSARVAAHRAKQARLDYTDEPAIALTIGDIARALDQSKQDVMRSLVRFALTNRNWKQLGLYGRKGA